MDDPSRLPLPLQSLLRCPRDPSRLARPQTLQRQLPRRTLRGVPSSRPRSASATRSPIAAMHSSVATTDTLEHLLDASREGRARTARGAASYFLASSYGPSNEDLFLLIGMFNKVKTVPEPPPDQLDLEINRE
ncbi:uncharacterized protein C8Q71DRAFT_861239 [Rhodofomes roseus]|uniref:Uncharacterized protein n=1 Tax=Rhodofomes roseus TaxID=34475 RepID=A0ABQ8K5U5_9APHY|nr:uncharacterized protein C8Q71DRAFT_861239 [Rhodofomes roseus]KAH9832350.1 hypothetical protein C8Q71DRAFT_861239 [Rhodofomes roseus]